MMQMHRRLPLAARAPQDPAAHGAEPADQRAGCPVHV